MGVGSLLLYFRLVGRPASYFPFWIPRLVIGLPLLAVMCVRQLRLDSVWALLEAFFVLLLLTLGLCARTFNMNHLGFLVQIGTLCVVLRLASDEPLPQLELLTNDAEAER